MKKINMYSMIVCIFTVDIIGITTTLHDIMINDVPEQSLVESILMVLLLHIAIFLSKNE